jgi:hypothetical protein
MGGTAEDRFDFAKYASASGGRVILPKLTAKRVEHKARRLALREFHSRFDAAIKNPRADSAGQRWDLGTGRDVDVCDAANIDVTSFGSGK